jgi:hypothetical protein
VTVERMIMTDALGKFEDLKFEIGNVGNLKFHISNFKFSSGLYPLIIITKDGSLYSAKFEIE